MTTVLIKKQKKKNNDVIDSNAIEPWKTRKQKGIRIYKTKVSTGNYLS